MKKHTLPPLATLVVLGISALGMLACSLTGMGSEAARATIPPLPETALPPAETAVPQPSPTPLPPTVEPTAIRIPVLVNRKIREELETPKYFIEIDYPFMENGGENGEDFNEAIQAEVQWQIQEFLRSVEENEAWRESSMPTGANSLYIDYAVTNTSHNLISIKFDMSLYMVGAAHPYPYTVTYTYDLAAGELLSLEDLFASGSDFLEMISEYAIDELQDNPAVFPDANEGALPTAENYRNWNVQADSLLITFDVYQVASYAAGPQLVEIPYSALAEIIDAQSPLNAFLDEG